MVLQLLNRLYFFSEFVKNGNFEKMVLMVSNSNSAIKTFFIQNPSSHWALLWHQMC